MGRKAITAESERGKDILTKSVPRAARIIQHEIDEGIRIVNRSAETGVYEPIPPNIMDAAKWDMTQILGKPAQAIEQKNVHELTIDPDFREFLIAQQRNLIEEQQQFLTDGEFHEVKD